MESTIPHNILVTPNRLLEPIDIDIIFRGAGSWWLNYTLLLFTGIKVVDIAMLGYWNVDFERGVLRRPESKSGRFSEWNLPRQVVAKIRRNRPPSEPLFPTLYTDVDDQSLFEEEMHRNLAKPLNYLHALLSIAHRPIASLFSFTLTNRYLLKDRDQLDQDYLEMRISIAAVLENTGAPPVLN